MLRDVKLEEISDGRIYGLNDMVKADTNGCNGCFKCCQSVGDTIKLTPFDVHMIKKATGKSFEKLLGDNKIEMNIVDGLILPNLKLIEGSGCSFLEDGRCSIHNVRPDICRLFPLGRIYTEEGIGYIIQKDECAKKDLSKIKVKKWIGIDNISENQEFIGAWHRLVRMAGDRIIELKKNGRGDAVKDITMFILNDFYVTDISKDISDTEIYNRLIAKINNAEKLINKI